MDKLNWDLRQICNRDKDGAFGTQAARWRSLDLMARELRAGRRDRGGLLTPRNVGSFQGVLPARAASARCRRYPALLSLPRLLAFPRA